MVDVVTPLTRYAVFRRCTSKCTFKKRNKHHIQNQITPLPRDRFVRFARTYFLHFIDNFLTINLNDNEYSITVIIDM